MSAFFLPLPALFSASLIAGRDAVYCGSVDGHLDSDGIDEGLHFHQHCRRHLPPSFGALSSLGTSYEASKNSSVFASSCCRRRNCVQLR